MDERRLPFPRPGERLVDPPWQTTRVAPNDVADELVASLALAPLMPDQRDRLDRAQRWSERLNTHPWRHAMGAGGVAVLAPLAVNVAEGAPATQNILPFGPALFGAIVALLVARYEGPRAARRRVIRLAKRYLSAGTEPNA